MFRTSDPLGTYAQDPRASKFRRSSISAATQTHPQYIQTDDASKKSSSPSKLTVILLGVTLLVASVALIVYLKSSSQGGNALDRPSAYTKSQRSGKMSQNEYLELDRISSFNISSKEFEEYMTAKIGAITRLNVDPDISRPINFYNEKTSFINNLKEKVNDLVTNRERLQMVIAEAETVEIKARELHGQYEKKIERIEQLGNQSLSKVNEVAVINNNISKWRKELENIQEKMTTEEFEFKGKRMEFAENLEKINQEIKETMKVTEQKEENLEGFIRERQQVVQEVEDIKHECERSISQKKELFQELKNKNQTLSHKLYQVELEAKQKNLQIHSLETAQELEEFVVKIRTLQKAHAEKAKKEIDEVINSLSSKEDEVVEIVRDKEGLNEEDKKKAIESLNGMIENEKALLNTWVWEQFKTLRISRDEIRNVTTYITDLNKNIASERGELEALVKRRKDLKEEVGTLPTKFEELKSGIQSCKFTIEDSGKKLEKENKVIQEHRKIMEKVTELRQKMQERQEVFVREEKELEQMKESLESDKERITRNIYHMKGNVLKGELEVKDITRQINELVESEPIGENVKRESQVYWDKVRIAETIHSRIKELVDEIKEIL